MALNNLPTHPRLRHPLTGQPLRAIWVDPTGRAHWPIMGASDDPPADPPAGDPPADPPPAPEFPANTPVAEMKPEEQAAYWRDKARKHEGRVKAFGNLTPDELAALRDKAAKHDALEHELMSEKDRAIAAAQAEARDQVESSYRPRLAETAFRVAIGDRKTKNEVDDFIADLNLDRFLTDDGQVDTAKVLSRVEQFAPATGTQQQRGPAIPRGGAGTPGSSSSSLTALSGSELYDRLHPKKTG